MSKSLSSAAAISIALVVAGGCASVPADLGRGDVEALLTARGQPIDEATSELLASLVARPLTQQSAVRIALLNSPQLQATYATLGFGAADVYAAGRIRNPVLSGAILDSNVPGERDQITFGLVTSFTDLITLRARKRLSAGAFAALQQSVGAEVLLVAAETERAYYGYVGAQQVAALRAQVAKAGALSAALAERFRDAGNLTPRELAMERAAASEAKLRSLEAQAEAYAARTALATVLGLSVGRPWQAPSQLHLPLQQEDELEPLLAVAQRCRLDLAAARTRADVLADRLGVVNWTRWLGDLDVGVERERETDGVRLTGPTVDWELPIFNRHRDALLRADADLQIAIADVRRVATAIDNEVRLAYAGVVNARARVKEHWDELIPNRVETVARGQEEVNFMLIGIFELINLKQEEYDSYQGYLEAIRDYWLARTDLSLAIGTVLPSSARITDQRIDVEEFVKPQSGGMDHSGHGGVDRSSPGDTDDSKLPADHSMHGGADGGADGTEREHNDDGGSL